MKTRWKILVAVVIFLAVLIGVWLLSMHVQPENAVEAYKKELREKGEKLEISEVTPPPVPDEKNGADILDNAWALMTPGNMLIPGMKTVAPGKDTPAWAQPDARDSDFTNTWDDFRNMMGPDRPALQMMQAIFERPQLDFRLDYGAGPEMRIPQLANLKRSAQKLSAMMECDLHYGDTGSATTNLCVLLAIANGEADERLFISQLVRIAIVSVGASDTWDYLQASNTTDAQLAMLQKKWEQLEFFSALEKTVWMERASTDDTIEKMRASRAYFKKMIGISPVASGSTGGSSGSTVSTWLPDLNAMSDAAKSRIGEMMWRLSWSYEEQLHQLQADQVVLETLRTMETNTFYKPDFEAMMSRLTSTGLTNVSGPFFHMLHIDDLTDLFGGSFVAGGVRKIVATEAIRRVVVTAIALKRFQQANGHWPEKLSELVPQFISSLPRDAIDGQPLRYRRNADGTYLLYSVGDDGVDDGGDPSLPTSVTTYWTNPRARDLVWPQLATAAEIEKYYADEAAKKK